MNPDKSCLRVYRLSGMANWAGPAFVAGVFVFVTVFMVIEGFDWKAIGVLLIFFAVAVAIPSLALWFWMMGASRIEVSEKGLRIRSRSFAFETPWENVERIVVQRNHHALVLRRPPEETEASKAFSAAAAFRSGAPDGGGVGHYNTPQEQQWLSEGRLIILATFSAAFRPEGLPADVRRYSPETLVTDEVPQLEKITVASPSGPVEPGATNSGIMQTSVLMVKWLVLGVPAALALYCFLPLVMTAAAARYAWNRAWPMAFGMLFLALCFGVIYWEGPWKAVITYFSQK